MRNNPNRPIKTIFIGKVRAVIFRNVFQGDHGPVDLFKVVLEIWYRARGSWKKTNSLSINEIPKAILALQQAYEFLMTLKRDQEKAKTD